MNEVQLCPESCADSGHNLLDRTAALSERLMPMTPMETFVLARPDIRAATFWGRLLGQVADPVARPFQGTTPAWLRTWWTIVTLMTWSKSTSLPLGGREIRGQDRIVRE